MKPVYFVYLLKAIWLFIAASLAEYYPEYPEYGLMLLAALILLSALQSAAMSRFYRKGRFGLGRFLGVAALSAAPTLINAACFAAFVYTVDAELPPAEYSLFGALFAVFAVAVISAACVLSCFVLTEDGFCIFKEPSVRGSARSGALIIGLIALAANILCLIEICHSRFSERTAPAIAELLTAVIIVIADFLLEAALTFKLAVTHKNAPELSDVLLGPCPKK